MNVTQKQVERLTKRIGQERVDQRESQVAAFLKLPLMEKVSSPVAHPPDLAVVSMDGGRLQILDRRPSSVPEPSATARDETLEAGSPTETSEAEQKLEPSQDRGGHWREDKIGLLMTMTSQESSKDPCPRIPETFVNPLRIAKLARAIKRGVPTGQDAVAEPPESEGGQEECGEYTPPKVRVKSMVGSRLAAGRFGQILVAAAFARGFFGARRKAFVGDGAETNWTIQQQWFSDFVAILDFIHALSYVFSAAMAGRTFRQGWAVYVRWISLVWQGRVVEVIKEMEQRQRELGLPQAEDSETGPRQIVADSLRYLKNNQDRMRYDEYRRLGLPIVSSHVESTVKQFNRRVKGTEKFWSEQGAEAVLQLRADYLSETEPMERFWRDRETMASGRRLYRRAV